MHTVTLGATGITTPQNGFGALPIQRISAEDAIALLRRAHEGGMTYFDTARAYSDSEDKVGRAFEGIRDEVIIASKSMARDPESLEQELETSLAMLRTDHIDVYQLHCVDQCYCPDDGTGMYEALQRFKEQGRILHFAITAHKLGIAEQIVQSGLYEVLQFPFSYLSTQRELKLAEDCAKHDMGFVAMKGLAGGLLTNARACMAWVSLYPNVVPIWGIQKPEELEQWLAFMNDEPQMDESIRAAIEADRAELAGDFCRGCGYCMPCPVDITIHQCARMSLMLRRAPSRAWLSEHWQTEMNKIEKCLHCHSCSKQCPYGLDTPRLLEENLEDYRRVLSGEVSV